MTDIAAPDPAAIHRGLGKVRSRRRLLWGTIFGYVPGLWLALQAGLGKEAMTWLFGGWVALLCLVVGMACVVKCPRCAKPFHTNGPTFLPVRKCVHCGLNVTADRMRSAAWRRRKGPTVRRRPQSRPCPRRKPEWSRPRGLRW